MLKRLQANILPLLLIALLVLVILNQLVFTPLILARGDTYNYFYPYWQARDMAFSAGNLPLWTHNIFMGAPLLANPQLGTFYPPNWLSPLFPDVTQSMRWSIVLHLIWAGWGAFALMRVVMPETGRLGAIVAGMLFAGGGYLGAHVEQINQLQGLAWLGWLFALYHRFLVDDKRLRWGLLLAGVWALQIFSGHTQTVAIAGIGMGVYGLVWWLGASRQKYISRLLMAIGGLAIMASVALLLALPQLLPTLELTGMSQRGGGFNAQEATAFSLPPTYIGRALLPMLTINADEAGQLFGEFVAYMGILGLGAVVIGAFAKLERDNWRRWAWIILLVMAFFFAFGRANPVYVWLAELPPFNLFRVPARWLALWALAGAILGGWGVVALAQGAKVGRSAGAVLVALITGLMLVARFAPVEALDVTGNQTITTITLAIWLGLLVLLMTLIWRKQTWLWALLIGVELALASAILPYNDLVPADVYTGQRFTISQMQAYADETPEGALPARYLSISPLYFDLGDRDAINARYEELGMNERAIRNAFVALKKQEVAFPNQSLAQGLYSVDGFGGGVLPTVYYSQFTSLALPANTLRTLDGRLGEILAREDCRGACIPPQRWLERMGVGYIITDKVYDVWHDDIAYDTQWAQSIAQGETVIYQANAPLISNHLHILAESGAWTYLADDSTSISAEHITDIGELALYRVALPQRDTLTQVTLFAETSAQLFSVSLVDDVTGNFAMLTPQGWRRALSSDIKIYATDDHPNRVYIAQNAITLPDTWQGSEQAIARLADVNFGTRDVVLHGDASPVNNVADGTATILRHTATALEVRVNSSSPSYLVLDTAWYPHWQAFINGAQVPVYRADVMFMAVPIPSGESVVSLRFAPQMWHTAGAIGMGAWVLWGLVVLVLQIRRWHR
jgi:hypothetical protein